MTTDNPVNEPNPQELKGAESTQPAGQDAPPPPRKRRWLRRTLLGIGILVLLLLILLALAPTIASTGWARSIVVNKINQNLNGAVSSREKGTVPLAIVTKKTPHGILDHLYRAALNRPPAGMEEAKILTVYREFLAADRTADDYERWLADLFVRALVA